MGGSMRTSRRHVTPGASSSYGARTGMDKVKLGLLRLTDAAPLIVAKELGTFAEEGLDVELSIEPSWANVADKIVYGLLDGAVMLPPLALAVTLGLRGGGAPLVVPMSLSLKGNTITLSESIAAEILRGDAPPDARAAARRLAALIGAGGGGSTRPALAVVHGYSTHNLLLRYWLAAGGLDPDRDVELTVVPPAQVVDVLRVGQIVGFCGLHSGARRHRPDGRRDLRDLEQPSRKSPSAGPPVGGGESQPRAAAAACAVAGCALLRRCGERLPHRRARRRDLGAGPYRGARVIARRRVTRTPRRASERRRLDLLRQHRHLPVALACAVVPARDGALGLCRSRPRCRCRCRVGLSTGSLPRRGACGRRTGAGGGHEGRRRACRRLDSRRGSGARRHGRRSLLRRRRLRSKHPIVARSAQRWW